MKKIFLILFFLAFSGCQTTNNVKSTQSKLKIGENSPSDQDIHPKERYLSILFQPT